MSCETPGQATIGTRTPGAAPVWFAPWGWIYRPTSWPGVGLSAGTVLFCTQVFLAVDRHSHSVSDTLYGMFPYVVPALMLLNWVAGKTSGQRGSSGGT